MATPDLTQSARSALAEIARILCTGYTGEIRIICNQGGIREVKCAHTLWIPQKPLKP